MSDDSSPPSASGARPRWPVAGPVLAALIGFAAGDAWRAPSEQTTARLGIAAIDAYRSTVSPVLARSGVVRCRFTPTCSEYGREAISRYGFPKGFEMTAGRVLRCNPWAEGGKDPVP